MNIILFTREEVGQPLPLNDLRARHILSVLRLGEGDSFEAGILDGPAGSARIVAVEKDSMLLDFSLDREVPLLYPVRLIIGFPRPIFAKRILKDLTTLGVREIHFTATDTGEKSYRDSRIWKDGEYLRHLREGAEQACCTRIPDVHFHWSLARAAAATEGRQPRIALDNYEPQMRLSEASVGAEGCVLAIGSERGWSDFERRLLRDEGFTIAGLGQRVLRTETACTAATAIVLARMQIM